MNFTDVTEFVLLGLTSGWEWQVLFFIIFFGFYVVTVMGNIGMIVLIKFNPQLAAPCTFSWAIYHLLMCGFHPTSYQRCWIICYQREKLFCTLFVCYSVSSLLPSSMWKFSFLLWWQLTDTWQLGTLCSMETKCQGLSVFGWFLSLIYIWLSHQSGSNIVDIWVVLLW